MRNQRPKVISKINRERRIQAEQAELSLLLRPQRAAQAPRAEPKWAVREDEPPILKTRWIRKTQRHGRFKQTLSAIAGIVVVFTSVFGLLSLTFMNSASAGIVSQLAEKFKRESRPRTGLVIHSQGTPPALALPKAVRQRPQFIAAPETRSQTEAQIAAVDTASCNSEVKIEEGGMLVETRKSQRKGFCRLLIHGHDTESVRSVALGEDGQIVFVSGLDKEKKKIATRTFYLFPRRNPAQAWRSDDGKIGVRLLSGEVMLLDPKTGLAQSDGKDLHVSDRPSLSRRSGLQIRSKKSVVMDFGFLRDGQKTAHEFRRSRITIRGPRGGVCLKVKVSDVIEWSGKDKEPTFRLSDGEVEELLTRKCRGLHRLDLSPFRELETAHHVTRNHRVSEAAAMVSRRQ